MRLGFASAAGITDCVPKNSYVEVGGSRWYGELGPKPNASLLNVLVVLVDIFVDVVVFNKKDCSSWVRLVSC